MANWVRSPSQRWFTNSRWTRVAGEAAKASSEKWNSFYGFMSFVFKGSDLAATIRSQGNSPPLQYLWDGEIGWSEYLLECGWGLPNGNGLLPYLLCRAARRPYLVPGICDDQPCGLSPCTACRLFCPPEHECASINSETGEIIWTPCAAALQMMFQCAEDNGSYYSPTTWQFWGGIRPELFANQACMCGYCQSGPIACNDSCDPEYIIPIEEIPSCISIYGGFVPCDSPNSTGCDVCDTIGPTCFSLNPCPCGVLSSEYGDVGGTQESLWIRYGDPCPALCCLPGEPSCIECCNEDDPNCGVWVPEDLCCLTCGTGCQPFGYPMPESFCQSCEYCNIDPNAPQCAIYCCQCQGSNVWLTCDEVEQGACEPPECADFSANCYECKGSYIPIWFGCYDEDPCPNPYNPDCTTGEEIVCYDYNTNDPIYYNASNLGASVIIEYDNPATGTPYAYGNIATLCAVPDSLQLCVYLVNGAGEKTQLAFESDFTINEQTATITIQPSVTVAGFAKIRFERCSNDKRMFLTFKDGAKLSAEDLNTSIHQLLFLIQEKEFASNTYYQVANDDGSGNALFTVTPALSSPFNFNLTSVGANDVLTWDGNGSFVGSSPSQVAGNMQLDNLSNVTISNASSGQFISFDGTNWVNTELPPSETYFVNWEMYNKDIDPELDDYYIPSCDTDFKNKWNAVTSDCLSQIEFELIPNAITSFGLGYYAADQQIVDQLANGNTSSNLQTFITNKINTTLGTGGRILTSLRWEIGRGEGRSISNVAEYPVAYFDIKDFDTLDHPGTGGTLTGSDPTASDLAYYRPWAGVTCASCKNKLYITNIEKFKFNGTKSKAFGLEFTSGTLNPSNDRYLKRVRSVINKADWGSALGYTESHPLVDYPSASSEYLNFVDGNEMIFAQYQFTDLLSLGNYANTKHVPSVITYYLANLWDGSTQTPPNWIVWDGNMDILGKIDDSGIPIDVVSYLGGNNNYWFYWRWWITGHDTDDTGGTPDKYDDLSYYNPFDPSKLSLEVDDNYTILPASTAATDYTTDPDNLTMAKTGSYSIKVDANKVFSNLERVLPDMYDEYVFEVQFSNEGSVSTSQCPDAKCYEIVAKIEKYIDGCDNGGTGCTQVGSGGSNSAGGGYHVYPTDFDANVVRVWDTYPYDKLGLEVRNKTGNGFDLVLKVPRLKRIGLIDVYKDSFLPNDGNFRQLALDWLADYHAHAWDDPTKTQPETNDTTNTDNEFPKYGDMLINKHNGSPTDGGSAAAFSLETAVQFIRLGIPANIRVSFYTITTPQTNLFEG